MSGESLGTFGGETAFSGEYDLRNRTAGTVFAGPPNFNTLFREFSDHRDPGSPEIQPVYKNGRTVRFATDAGRLDPARRASRGTAPASSTSCTPPTRSSGGPRTSCSTEPDWIGEAAGKDVLQGMFWMPFVTFWQVTADLPFSTGVPAGHGHKYTTEYVDAWNAVMRPDGRHRRRPGGHPDGRGSAGLAASPRSRRSAADEATRHGIRHADDLRRAAEDHAEQLSGLGVFGAEGREVGVVRRE